MSVIRALLIRKFGCYRILEAVFADIEIDTLREEFRKAQDSPERIPSGLKPLIATTDFPAKLAKTFQKVAS